MSTKRVILTILATSALLLVLGIGFNLVEAQSSTHIQKGIAVPKTDLINYSARQPDQLFNTTFTSNGTRTSRANPEYNIQAGTITGGNYQLTTLCQKKSNILSGGSYSIIDSPNSGLWGNCCCTYLPVVKK